MKFIELNTSNGKTLVNTQNITYIHVVDGKTQIFFNLFVCESPAYRSIVVKESYEAVRKLINNSSD